MAAIDDAVKVAQHVRQMAEIIAQKPEGQRSITIRKADAAKLASFPHHGTIDALRKFCIEHRIKFREV